MSHTLATSRLGRWGVAMAVGLAGALGFASTANATIYTVTTGGANGGTQLRDFIIAANANPGLDKILLPSVPMFPPNNLTITDDLYISGDHKHEAETTFEGPSISGQAVDNPNVDFITVAASASVAISGVEFTTSASFGVDTIQVNGDLRVDNSSFLGNAGVPIGGDTITSNIAVTNTLFQENTQLGPAIRSAGPLYVNGATFVDNFGGGIQVINGSRFELRNSVLQTSGGFVQDCYGAPTVGSGNFDRDGSCGDAATGDAQFEPFAFYYGGPTQSRPPLPTSPLVNAGDSAFCLSTDQAFDVRPAAGGCDIGSFEVGAAEDTTAPECAVTATRRGPDQQDVTVSDSGSGVASFDAVFSEQVTITNGLVSFPAFPATGLPGDPARPGNLVVTAAKSDQGQKTRWSFTARDWSGNTRTCS